MHAGALKALEFDRVVEAVRRFALTPLGDARLAALRPQTDFRAVQKTLAATTEVVKYLGDNPIFPLDAPRDLELILAGLAIEERAWSHHSCSGSLTSWRLLSMRGEPSARPLARSRFCVPSPRA